MTREYDEQEVSLILKRALEPSEADQVAEAPGSGLSLEQIKDVAKEVGIDPARIEVAAASLDQIEPYTNPILGIPTTVRFQSTIEDRVLEDDEVGSLLNEIRWLLGGQGIVNQEIGSTELRASDALGSRYVSVATSKEGTDVRVLGNYREGTIRTFAAVGIVSATLAGVLFDGSGLSALVMVLGVFGAAIIPPTFAYRWWRRREEAKLRRVFDRVVAFLGSPSEGDGSVD